MPDRKVVGGQIRQSVVMVQFLVLFLKQIEPRGSGEPREDNIS